MELNVKVESILQPETYTRKSDGTQVTRNSFVGVYSESGYTKRVRFEVANAEMWGRMNIRVGATYQVSFDVESRSWEGQKGVMWFTSCNAYRAIAIDAPQQQNAATQQQVQTRVQPQPAQASPQQGEDLPF